jgi:hypothetical protein
VETTVSEVRASYKVQYVQGFGDLAFLSDELAWAGGRVNLLNEMSLGKSHRDVKPLGSGRNRAGTRRHNGVGANVGSKGLGVVLVVIIVRTI